MSASHSPTPRSSGFFVWRTPALTFDRILSWGASLRAPAVAEPGPALAAALEEDRKLLRERLREVLERPAVREALFIASPDLDERMHVWERDPDSSKGRRIECAAVRYFQRMAARATPFGLFSGCSLGKIGEATALERGEPQDTRRHSRLDMHYLSALVESLESQPELREHLSYQPNSSLYQAAGRYRYAEARLSGGGRSYHLVAVDVTDYLETALQRAATGAAPAEIIESIRELRPDVSREEAAEYVGELIDSQILISDLAPTVTGNEPIAELVTRLRKCAPARETADLLQEVHRELQAMDTSGPGIERERYRRVAEQLGSLPAPVELPRLFQVDLVPPVSAATLGEEPVAEILRGIEILHRLQDGDHQDDLTRFRDAFLARYDGAEVPLVQALDEELGIGLGSPDRTSTEAAPLLAKVGVPAAGHGEGRGSSWRTAHDVLLDKLLQAVSRGDTEIDLEEDDLERMASRRSRQLPPAFAMTATVAAPSARDVARGDFRVLLGGAGGPSGARLLGRFCHADEALQEAVKSHLRAEESRAPDAVFAEVVHLPEGRLGNILFRPVLRTHEIPFLGRSGAPAERQIPVTDLMVSVSAGRIVLRSKRLGREIVPRLTSAHNFSNQSLPVYRFLCSLQSQGTAPWLMWSWGPLQSADFLPRVRCGRLVLSRARWRIAAEELEGLGKEDAAGRFLRVRRWRATRRIPRFVLLSDADNELLVDLDNILSIDGFADVVKKRPMAILTEMFPGPDELMARGPEGRFVHEIILPFVVPREQQAQPDTHAAVPAHTVHSPAAVSSTTAQRSFPPGSDWLYAKIYAGASTTDRILRQAVAPLARHVLSTGAADRWFFIRYGDPDWHLRIRFHGSPGILAEQVLPALQHTLEPLRSEGQLWRVQLDTYEREMERYGGGEGVLALEHVSQIDSEAVLEIIAMLDGDEGADARWRLALCGLDRLLDDFGFDMEGKLAIAKQRRAGFGHEFDVDKGFRIRLGNTFREHRDALNTLFASMGNGTHDADEELGPGLMALRSRSARLAPLTAGLRELSGSGRLAVPLENIVVDLAHMFANRLLLSAHRAQELVLWDFLERIYASRVARASRKTPTAVRRPA